MYTQDGKYYIARSTEPVYLLPQMANRHGLIAGATGTGKTVTLQVLAETFSQAGIPCFMSDMKGDLSGISQTGKMSAFIQKRCSQWEMPEPTFAPCPTRFWDVFGTQGHPMRTTVSAMGPILLSRILELNPVQSGILNIVFRIADDRSLLLIDLKDLRQMLSFVGQNAKEFTLTYGNISSQSIGAIQRSLLALEDQGGEKFFGEPDFQIFDLLQSYQGKGVMNVLAADQLMQSPKLYSTFLLWLLSELYTQLPEVGDIASPKLVFFFDEAHMLFDDTPKALTEKIEQIVRLIRSKGVGVFFITQNPADIPDSVLGQLGNRIQHALRAFTPKDQAAIRTASRTFRANPSFSTEEAITALGTGEALVSFLDEKGAPSMVERAKILFPLSQIGAITPQQREEIIRQSPLFGRYENAYDRESAYEVLQKEQAEALQKAQAEEEALSRRKEEEVRRKEEDARRKQEERIRRQAESGRRQSGKRQSTRMSPWEKAIGSAASSIGRQVGSKIVRSLLGSIFK